MLTHATPEYLITPMRELTLPELTYFHVATTPTPFAELDRVLDPLIGSSMRPSRRHSSLKWSLISFAAQGTGGRQHRPIGPILQVRTEERY